MTVLNPYDRNRGFASLDALLCLVPLLLMLILIADAASSFMRSAEQAAHRQRVFDRIVSVADYTVKIGAARHEGGIRYPNWVDADAITAVYSESMRVRAGLSSLYIGLDEPDDVDGADGGFPICIYRLVVVGDELEIRKLRVCGG
jgi:hypothetical protein